tara:strand:- start:101 stop:217 length:117 start_codon:yes stop_codon:yes gene_type:complete
VKFGYDFKKEGKSYKAPKLETWKNAPSGGDKKGPFGLW